MQTIALIPWGTLNVFGPADAETPGTPTLPAWLPAGSPYRAARLMLHKLPGRPPLDFIAAWPDGATAPDPDDDASWTTEQLDGVLLLQAQEHFRCRGCGRRVNALYADTGLPFFNQVARHRFATHCPHCGLHVDQARLHAVALFATRDPDGN